MARSATSIASLPAPVGGWNAFDAVADMEPQDAVLLDNFFPASSYLSLRGGYQPFCSTGASGAVRTLMEYAGGTGDKLLACADGTVFDVSSGTASTLGTGFHADTWSYVNYSTGGGTYVIAANASGADAPQVYNGSTLTALSVTGVTAANLSIVTAHAQRMFYVERGTLKVWYTTAGAYQGALTAFDFGPLCTRGGQIAALGTWTRDNGFGGGDDLFVVVTSMGEVLAYNGTNPSDATAWALTGRFSLGRPVSGPQCLVRTGPDLLLLNEDGYQPLSAYLTIGSTQALTTNLARKISTAAGQAVANYRGNPGWQGLTYPQGAALLINIPTGATTFQQHVVNTATGAWCRYTGLNAYCWSLFQSRPFFGGAGGVVHQFDTGLSDNGADIVGELVSAFSYLRRPGQLKRFTMVHTNAMVNGLPSFSLGMEVDFVVSNTLPTVSSNNSGAGVWDSAVWDASTFDAADSQQRLWASVSGIGYAGAVHLKISTHTQRVRIYGFDLAFQAGASI